MINPKWTSVGGYSKPEVNFLSNQTFQTLSIQGYEKRVMGANENRVRLYTYNGIMRDERKEGTSIYIQRYNEGLTEGGYIYIHTNDFTKLYSGSIQLT